MGKALGAAAAGVTLLTLLTLGLDLPSKAVAAYRSLTKAAPDLRWSVLFDRQGPIEISPYSKDKKRYSHFYWPTVYVFHNPGREDVAVADLVNLLPARKVKTYRVEVVQEVNADRPVYVYDSFQRLDSGTGGVKERFPIIIKAGEKKYLSVGSRYRVLSNGKEIFCKPKDLCRQLIAVAFGLPSKPSSPVPCPFLPFQTRVDSVGYRSATASQTAYFLTPGCRREEPQRVEETSLSSSGWPGVREPQPGASASKPLWQKIREAREPQPPK